MSNILKQKNAPILHFVSFKEMILISEEVSMKKFTLLAAVLTVITSAIFAFHNGLNFNRAERHIRNINVNNIIIDPCTGKKDDPVKNEPEVEVTVDGNNVTVKHFNSTFNCCPDTLYGSIEQDQTEITLKEYGIGGMCDCICDFPFTFNFTIPQAGTYTIKIWSYWYGEIWEQEIEIESNEGFGKK